MLQKVRWKFTTEALSNGWEGCNQNTLPTNTSVGQRAECSLEKNEVGYLEHCLQEDQDDIMAPEGEAVRVRDL